MSTGNNPNPTPSTQPVVVPPTSPPDPNPKADVEADLAVVRQQLGTVTKDRDTLKSKLSATERTLQAVRQEVQGLKESETSWQEYKKKMDPLGPQVAKLQGERTEVLAKVGQLEKDNKTLFESLSTMTERAKAAEAKIPAATTTAAPAPPKPSPRPTNYQILIFAGMVIALVVLIGGGYALYRLTAKTPAAVPSQQVSAEKAAPAQSGKAGEQPKMDFGIPKVDQPHEWKLPASIELPKPASGK